MHTRLTAKLFHTVVVLGVGLTAGCTGDTVEPDPTPATTASSSSSGATTTEQKVADAGSTTTVKSDAGKTSSSSSSSSGDAFPGWMCCG